MSFCNSFILFKWLFGLAEAAEPTLLAIYNSLRYDDDTHTVTFHLREKDWNELKSKSLMWISSYDLNPIIKHETVRLGDEVVESARRVDPVEKFGLSAAQTYTVPESNKNCQVLKVR